MRELNDNDTGSNDHVEAKMTTNNDGVNHINRAVINLDITKTQPGYNLFFTH